MSKKKKNGHKKSYLEKVLLATAIIELIKAIIELIDRLLR